MRIPSLLFILCSANTVAQTTFEYPNTTSCIDHFALVNGDTLNVDNSYWYDGTWELYCISSKDSAGNIKNYMVRHYNKKYLTTTKFYWDNHLRAEKSGQIYTTFYPDGEIESITKYKEVKVAQYYDMCGGGNFAGYAREKQKKRITYYGRDGSKIKTEKFYPKRERRRRRY